PAKPTTALSTTSGSARSSSLVRSPPTWVSGATPSIARDPDAAAASSSSGWLSTISRAWRPIEPVTPSTATRFINPSVRRPLRFGSRQRDDREVGRDRREQRCIEPVQHPSVTGEQAAAVLDAEVSLDRRLEQVADG